MPLDTETGIWESDYVPPAARELPAIRSYLCDLMRDPQMLTFHAGMIATGRFALRPARDPVAAAGILLAGERERLAKATLYWVSPQMTQVARAAAGTLPEDLRIDETHQPADHGLIVFGEPIGSYIGDQFGDRRINITAMTWGPTCYPTENDPATWVTFYSNRDEDYIRHVLSRMVGRTPRRGDLDAAVRGTPEWMWDNESVVTRGHTIGELNVVHERTTTPQDQSLVPWLKVLYSSWLLMTQPGITQVSQQRSSRQQQRHDQRHGIRRSDVHLVHIHQRHRDSARASTQPSDTAEREYSVRWMVRGHWRNQAHGPDRALRRPVWINPYVKGPAGKPIKTGTIVHVWDR